MQTRLLSLIFCLALLQFSCGDAAPDPLLEEAFTVHEEAVKHSKEVKYLLEQLPADSTQVVSLKKRFDTWKENQIEVPGFEHSHDHDHDHDHGDHDHDHDHGPGLELTPEDMLLVQKEMRDSILVIKAAAEALK